MEKQEKKFVGYYEFLQYEIDKFRGNYDPYINYLPDIFKLLANLLNTDVLEKEERRLICCALGYFVAPDDVIPEELYGPSGYADDMFICCCVLGMLEQRCGMKVLQNNWEHEDGLDEVLEYAAAKSLEVVKSLGVEKEILAYVGLD